MIKIIEGFGGIGAATTALKNPVIIDYVDNDKNAVKVFNYLHNTNYKPKNIKDIDIKKYPIVDILMCGGPCQDISQGGSQKGLKNTRSGLIGIVINKLKEMKKYGNLPKNILLENVKALLTARFADDLAIIKTEFESLGYVGHQALLNARNFGIPQNRERVYILCSQKPIKNWSELSKIKKTLKPIKINKTIDFFNYQWKGIPKDMIKKYSNFVIIPRKSDNKLINGYHNRVGTGDYCGTICASAQPLIGIVKNLMLFYRKLTLYEIYKLMGFNNINIGGLKLICSESTLKKLAGNSIVVPVLEVIIKNYV